MARVDDVEALLRSEFGARLGAGALDPEQDLLAAGVIDSFGLIGLISALEGRFGIEVADQDVVPDHFQSLSQITAFVDSKLGGAAAGGASADS